MGVRRRFWKLARTVPNGTVANVASGVADEFEGEATRNDKKESDECTSLALLLGDAHLRKRCEALGAVLPLRCTAVEAEQVMMAAIAARDRIAKENLNGLASDDGDEDDEGEDKKNNGIEKPNRWAQAALEGLPENDRIEQEKIAMENATGVRSSRAYRRER